MNTRFTVVKGVQYGTPFFTTNLTYSAIKQHAAVTILHIGRMYDRLHQQALRVDQNVSLLAFDLLARIVARRVAVEPPFSALLTLWLSMIAAVGLASRPACSRHCTYSA